MKVLVKIFSKEDLTKKGTLKKKNNAIEMTQAEFKEYVDENNLKLSKGYIDNIGHISNDKIFSCRAVSKNINIMVGVTGTIEYVEKETFWAVIRLEAENEEDEKAEEYAQDFLLEAEEIDGYLHKLEENKILRQSGYVGNAYFIETTDKEEIIKFHKLINERFENFKDIEGLNHKLKLSIEWNYYPDWAEEIKKQNEEE